MTVEWRVKATELANCNCAYGCPCQFNSLPTHGNCRAAVAMTLLLPRITVDWDTSQADDFRTRGVAMDNQAKVVGARSGDAERPQESGVAALGRGGRMSRQRKSAAVLRLLR